MTTVCVHCELTCHEPFVSFLPKKLTISTDEQLFVICTVNVPEFAIDKPSPSISPWGLIDGFFSSISPRAYSCRQKREFESVISLGLI